MGRPKEFNPDEALDSAMQVFHLKGFLGTSMQDLVDAMGIGRGSLYETYGSKEALFKKALAHYSDCSQAMMMGYLGGAKTPLEGLRALLNGMVETHLEHDDRRGCMVVNTIVELAPHDPEFAPIFHAIEGQLQAMLTDTIQRAQEAGEIPPERSPDALARFLVGVIQGLGVQGKYNRDREGLAAITDTAMAALV